MAGTRPLGDMERGHPDPTREDLLPPVQQLLGLPQRQRAASLQNTPSRQPEPMTGQACGEAILTPCGKTMRGFSAPELPEGWPHMALWSRCHRSTSPLPV